MPRNRPYAEKHTYEYASQHGTFELRTYTRSEARSLFKKKIGVSRKGRLPVGADVRRID
jgi:hypothetical protein